MSQVIPADITINSTIAQNAIEDAFDLSVSHISLLGEGWDNSVFLINKTYVFRFPRRKVAIPLIEREMRTLPILKHYYPLQTPDPLFTSSGNQYYSIPFYGHQIIKGTTGCKVNLNDDQYHQTARALGQFLNNLKKIDINRVQSKKDAMKPVFDRMNYPSMVEKARWLVESIQKNYDISQHSKKIDQIIKQANEYSPSKASSMVHGDLYHRHLVFEPNKTLFGIIDWGDCCVSDPVIDLIIVYQFLPPKFHNSFWQEYGDSNKQQRSYARFLGLHSTLALLWFGHDRKDLTLIDSSLQTLDHI